MCEEENGKTSQKANGYLGDDALQYAQEDKYQFTHGDEKRDIKRDEYAYQRIFHNPKMAYKVVRDIFRKEEQYQMISVGNSEGIVNTNDPNIRNDYHNYKKDQLFSNLDSTMAFTVDKTEKVNTEFDSVAHDDLVMFNLNMMEVIDNLSETGKLVLALILVFDGIEEFLSEEVCESLKHELSRAYLCEKMTLKEMKNVLNLGRRTFETHHREVQQIIHLVFTGID